MLAASTLHLLSQPFPPSEGYAEIRETLQMTGGEALNSSLVLHRLGLSVRLDGNWLGDNPGGRRLLKYLRQASIDTGLLRIRKGYAGAEEVVCADSTGRTVFGNYLRINLTSRQWNIPRKSDLAGARVANIDPFFREESVLAAHHAVRLGIPFVTVDSPPDTYASIHAAINIVSREFLLREFPGYAVDTMMDVYLRQSQGLVVLTDGAADILFARRGGPVRRFRPFRIKAVDTTGAGDSFRAGMVMGLYHGWGDEEAIRYASAVAALVCLSFPGVLRSPIRRQVSDFLKTHSEIVEKACPRGL
jgi:sugar/nucleoside kinase (ribokinase family)